VKLTKTEENAKLLCEWIRKGLRKGLIIEWRKSHTWGMNPHISLGDDREAVRVSGCGYCKESTALAHCLCWLLEPDTEAFKDVSRTAGRWRIKRCGRTGKTRLEAGRSCERKKRNGIQRHENLVETGATRAMLNALPRINLFR